MIYRSGERLFPVQVRETRFSAKRRGLDPEQVYDFLAQLAVELTRLHRDLATAETETERIKQGLRQWHARHTGCRFGERPGRDEPADRRWPIRVNRGHW